MIDAFSQFVPCKSVPIRVNDQPWSNTYTRLLLRKKNRNYLIYKKINSDFNYLSNQANASPELLTRYLAKKNKAHSKARDAANSSNLAKRRTTFAFYNTVNCTIPIFKRVSSKNCKTNYRPISILPTLSKVCESIIHE